jgi:organic radical activating enzyme
VKIVVGASVDPGEFDAAITMVAKSSDRPEVFLQPVTPFAAVTEAPTPDQVLDLQARALRLYPNVRVVPQTHKAIGQL